MKYRLLFLLLFVIPGCSSKPHIVTQTDISTPTSKDIYIVSHGWHTGFVIPAETIQSELPQLVKRFGKTPYLEFGWGDKGFYQAEEITSSLTLRAIFWPTESVVHTVSIPVRPDLYFSNSDVRSLCLESNRYSLLLEFIKQSFYQDNEGNIRQLKHGIYGNSQFYKGEGDYYLMNTCNKWTAKGLRSAGLDIIPTFKLTADSIMDYLAAQDITLSSLPCKKKEIAE